MDIETIVVKVIAKMRSIFCFGEYKDIVKNDPLIEVSLRDNKLVLGSISFNSWDSIIFTPTCVRFCPEHGNSKTLMTFESVEDFLSDATDGNRSQY